MENSYSNNEVPAYRNYVSLIELEHESHDSFSFLSLCKFLRSKNYSVIPQYIFLDLKELKRNNSDKKFCIRDSSEKSSREHGKLMNTFEVR